MSLVLGIHDGVDHLDNACARVARKSTKGYIEPNGVLNVTKCMTRSMLAHIIELGFHNYNKKSICLLCFDLI
jgi:hypothetical protein